MCILKPPYLDSTKSPAHILKNSLNLESENLTISILQRPLCTIEIKNHMHILEKSLYALGEESYAFVKRAQHVFWKGPYVFSEKSRIYILKRALCIF